MDIFVLSLTAAFNPTLFGATTVMLLMPEPRRLLFGYLIGALLTSITCGLVIVFSLQGSGAVKLGQNTLSPADDFIIGACALGVAWLLQTERDRQLKERRARRRESKGKAPKKDSEPPRWQRALRGGSARSAFIVGAVLTLPGASYLAALSKMSGQKWATAVTVLVVLAFNLVMLAFLELPILSYQLSPDATPGRVAAIKSAINRHGRKTGIRLAALVGALLIIRGTIELL